MSESKLPNLIIGLTVDSTGIDAGLNRAKSKISRFGGGSGGGVNSGVNNGTGGWGAGGGNNIGDAVLGAALGAGVARGGGNRKFYSSARESKLNKIADDFKGKVRHAKEIQNIYLRGITKSASRRLVGYADDQELPFDLDKQETYRNQMTEAKKKGIQIIENNRRKYISNRRNSSGFGAAVGRIRQGIEGSVIGRAATALGMSARLGPLAIAGTAYAIGAKVANYQRDEVARTSDLTRFKGSADYGKYQQMKYDYISKPRIEDQRSMGASAASTGGAGSQTATDKLMGVGSDILGGIGWVAGAAFENVAELFFQNMGVNQQNKQIALDIIDRRKNSI